MCDGLLKRHSAWRSCIPIRVSGLEYLIYDYSRYCSFRTVDLIVDIKSVKSVGAGYSLIDLIAKPEITFEAGFDLKSGLQVINAVRSSPSTSSKNCSYFSALHKL